MNTLKPVLAFFFAFILSAAVASAGGVTYPPKQISDEGTTLVLRPTLNFAGAGVTCADDTTRTTCTIPGSGSAYSTIQDEGASLTQRSTLNFIGSAVTCTDTGSRTDCTITGGGGGANTVEYSATFGTTATAGLYTFTVTGQSWVTTSSIIVCQPLGTTADGLTAEAIALAELRPIVLNRIAGTGFSLLIYNPHGLAGTVRIHCLGQ
jgi:hypothetical protein